MKRLDQGKHEKKEVGEVKKIPKKKEAPIDTSIEKLPKDKVLTTKTTATKDEAIEAKMAQLEPKIFGIKTIHYENIKVKKVWVPCHFLVYDYKVNKSLVVKEKEYLVKKGEVAVVYDANEMHAAHYDLIAEGEIPLVKRDVSEMDGHVLEDKDTYDKVLENAERSIQRQVLFKAYKSEGKLKLKRHVKFYREAYELTLQYKDRTFKRYAYLDDYGVKNERARGLRARMDNI